MNTTLLTVLLTAHCLLSPIAMPAQTGEKPKLTLMERLMKFKAFGDSMAIKGIDRNYIELPERAFSAEARTTFHQASLHMDTNWAIEDGDMAVGVDMNNELNAAVGLWAGYRGIGIGLSKMVSGGKGSSLSLGLAGGIYSANIRLTSYETSMPALTIEITGEGEPLYEHRVEETDNPIRVRSLYLDAFYFFNGKRYTYLAAADQSLIQRRSAGSFTVGAMYDHTSINCSDNIVMSTLMHSVGRQKFTQASAGAGYGYNWVPGRGWLLSAMVMPMLTFYNRTETIYYSLKYMGKETEEEKMLRDIDNYKLQETEAKKTANRVVLNYNARMSVVYNWPRVYARVFGHYNHFRYRNDENKGHVSDWTVHASVGYRF